MSTKFLLVIVGPTAIGKTALSIQLAKYFQTEILSADSRQFYKELQIGTAVPSRQELSEATHHFIQHISITESYSVGAFEKEALQRLQTIFQNNDVAILVGGSGLYSKAVTDGLDIFPEVLPGIKEQIKNRYHEGGIEALQEQLKKVDPNYYNSVDLNNTQRVMRALEVSISSGKPFSSFRTQNKAKRPFTTIKIGLNADRAVLYDRINRRVDQMILQGLEQEVKSLVPYKDLNALQTVGYKELFDHFDGKFTFESAIEEIKKNTRRFAKRQGTWFRKDAEITWFDYTTPLATISKYIQEAIRNYKVR